MEGATHFIEQWRDSNEKVTDYTFSISGIDLLKEYLAESKASGFKTIAVWRIKPKTILITGEEINGQSVLIAEKI